MRTSRKSSEPPAVGTPPPTAGGADLYRPSIGASLGAFVATLAGVGDLRADDPHRGAKWAGGLVGLAITAIFVRGAIRGHRAARREGYAAGLAAARERAALPLRARKR